MTDILGWGVTLSYCIGQYVVLSEHIYVSLTDDSSTKNITLNTWGSNPEHLLATKSTQVVPWPLSDGFTI